MSLSLWKWGQVTVITVKEVPQKECRLPHSHLYYLSTCQSICLFASKPDKLHLQKKHVSHAPRNEGRAAPKIWHADQPLTVFHQFQIIAPVKYRILKYFIKAVSPTVIRLTAQSGSHYICLSLWLEFHFKCQVNSYFPEQSKDWTKKGKERHSWDKRGKEITCFCILVLQHYLKSQGSNC